MMFYRELVFVKELFLVLRLLDTYLMTNSIVQLNSVIVGSQTVINGTASTYSSIVSKTVTCSRTKLLGAVGIDLDAGLGSNLKHC